MKKVIIKKSQNGSVSRPGQISGVVVSKKDEKANPDSFSYLTKKEKAASAAPKKKIVVAKKKNGGSMGKCKGGCS